MSKNTLKILSILIAVFIANTILNRAPLPIGILSLIVVPVCIGLLCNFLIKHFYNKNE